MLVLAEGTLLDQGPGIDARSLRREGDRLTWLHDGAMRSAAIGA